MKKSFGPKTALFPLPVVLIGTYDIDGKPNLMTASWTGIVNSTPEMLSISVRKIRATYRGLEENKEFTITFASTKQMEAADYCGVFSHKETDKISDLGLNHQKAQSVNAPEFTDFSTCIDCRVKQQLDLGTHIMYIAEIIDLRVDEAMLSDGNPDINKIDPLIYDTFSKSYFALGSKIGRAYTSQKIQK